MSGAACGKLGAVLSVAGALLIAGPLSVWAATGAEGYTRWPNAKLRAADAEAPPEQADLLADIGFEESGEAEEPEPEIVSRFALGLVPGGFDPKHLLAVAPLGVVGAACISAAMVVRRRGKRLNQAKECPA